MGVIIFLLCGMLGGVVSGVLLPNFSLGTFKDAIIGALSLGIGGAILRLFRLDFGGSALNFSNLIENFIQGAVGTAVVLLLFTIVKIFISNIISK